MTVVKSDSADSAISTIKLPSAITTVTAPFPTTIEFTATSGTTYTVNDKNFVAAADGTLTIKTKDESGYEPQLYTGSVTVSDGSILLSDNGTLTAINGSIKVTTSNGKLTELGALDNGDKFELKENDVTTTYRTTVTSADLSSATWKNVLVPTGNVVDFDACDQCRRQLRKVVRRHRHGQCQCKRFRRDE